MQAILDRTGTAKRMAVSNTTYKRNAYFSGSSAMKTLPEIPSTRLMKLFEKEKHDESLSASARQRRMMKSQKVQRKKSSPIEI